MALVTGGGRGIGRGAARALAALGAGVVVAGRSAAPLEETCAALARAGADARPLCADVTAPDFCERLERVAPRVDVLVHAAVRFAPYGRLETVPAEDVALLLDSVLGAALRLVAHCLPGMRERGFGRIVHVGTIAAETGAAGQTAYACAKSGLVGLTRSTALEAGRAGVTSNLVELGLIETERVLASVAPAVRAALVEATPVGRIGTVEDAARVIAFLASPASGFVNGACIPVSGGLELGLVARRLSGGGG